MSRWLTPLRWSWRLAFWCAVAAYFALALGILGLRHYVLPKAPDYREHIERMVSEAVGERVTIGGIAAGWNRLHPTLDLDDLRLHDRAGNVALALGKVGVEVSWRSLVVGELRFHSIVIDRPMLAIHRDAQGQLNVAGIALRPADGAETGGGGLADWLLRQGDVIITDGRVEWTDAQRKAPMLALHGVHLRLANTLTGEHQVRLVAAPPERLAAAIDVRAHFRGNPLAEPGKLRGDAYAELRYADLAAWKPWVDYPFAMSSGRGALRVWAALEAGRVRQVTADVALAGVNARLAPRLPPLALARVQGRITVTEVRQGVGFFGMASRRSHGWRVAGDGIEVSLASGRAPEPASFAVQWERKPGAEVANAGGADQGEFRASLLELGKLAEIAEALPLPADVRRLLTTHEPRGRLRDVVGAWTGSMEAVDTYQMRARFEDIGFRGRDTMPGLTGVSGSLEATQRGGNVTLAGGAVTLSFPRALRSNEPLAFDTFNAQAGWTIAPPGREPRITVKVPALAIANPDIAVDGMVEWRSSPDSPGLLDVDLRVPKGNARTLYRHIPWIPDAAADWLREGLLAGTLTDGRVRIRGDIQHIPYMQGEPGTLRVEARTSDLTLKFAPDFPAFERLEGNFVMNGLALDVHGTRARLHGIELGETRVSSPNLDDDIPVISVRGDAQGPTADFLRFIAESPLRDTIGPATARLRAEGRGRIALDLRVHPRHPERNRVGGSFEFLGNTLVFSPSDPPVRKLAGRIDFLEDSIVGRHLTGEFLDGPVRADLTIRDGDVTLTGTGTTSIAAARKSYPFPFDRHAEGTVRYQARIAATASTFDLALQSDLQGVRIDLPPPFGKAAAAAAPMRLERVIREAPQGQGPPVRNDLHLTVAPLLTARATFRLQEQSSVLDRMAVMVGDATAALPDRPMITVHGRLPALDLDQLVPVLRRMDEAADASSGPPLGPVRMDVADLVVIGRRLHDARFELQMRDDGWNAHVAARELAGDLRWRFGGKGSLAADFERFVLPDPAVAEAQPESPALRELPALEVRARSFTAHGKDFGALDLSAVNEAGGWRLKDVKLVAPEGRLTATGFWQPPDRGDRTEVDVVVETTDIGGYLARMGQAGVVAGGNARLAGKLAWRGPPSGIDYPTLAGALTIRADAGRFLRADPGIGRLLGVVSLQALPRRMNLDFRDVFTDGFSFDDIQANATIGRGVMHTSDFRMAGPSAVVGLSGDTDLLKETQRMRVRVVPIVGDSIAAMAGLALLNPVVGIGTLIAQRLLQDPLGQILAYEYAITGTWADPRFERVSIVKPPDSREGVEPSP